MALIDCEERDFIDENEKRIWLKYIEIQKKFDKLSEIYFNGEPFSLKIARNKMSIHKQRKHEVCQIVKQVIQNIV